MEAVSFDDALQQADQVIVDALLQKGKALAEIKEKVSDREWSTILKRHRLTRKKANNFIEITESPRVNDPANRPYVTADQDALGQLLKMKDTSYDQWRTEAKDSGRKSNLRDLKTFREKVEPTPDQLKKKERLEAQKARQEGQAEEREQRQGRRDQFKFTLYIRDEKGQVPRFKFGADPRALILTDERLAIEFGFLYFPMNYYSDQAVWVVQRKELRSLANQLSKLAQELELEESSARKTVPLPEFLDAQWERPRRSKPAGSKLCPGCRLKTIAGNKELCRECSEAANPVAARPQEAMHAQV